MIRMFVAPSAGGRGRRDDRGGGLEAKGLEDAVADAGLHQGVLDGDGVPLEQLVGPHGRAAVRARLRAIISSSFSM